MIKISEILKRLTLTKDNDEDKSGQKAIEKETFQFVKSQLSKGEKEGDVDKSTGIRISNITGKVMSIEESIELYNKAYSMTEGLFADGKKSELVVDEKIIELVEKITDQLILGNNKLLMLAFIKESDRLQYVYYHSVNVCIYSIEVGLGLNYEKYRLIELGISALLHDLGLANIFHIIAKNTNLTIEEYNEVKKHVMVKIEIINKHFFKEKTKQDIHQHHERADGSGYPLGLKEKSINENAKIIGLMDIYEAMTHSRTYRTRHTALETIQNILNGKNSFEQRLVKILIERIGIYPMGSLVILNTKETAQVIKINCGNPIRPVVKIIYDANNKVPNEEKIIDLTKYPAISIKSEEKINLTS